MPTVVGSHSVASFVNPSNGDALDADVVKGNDNTLRTSYVAHDADPGVHVQSSLVAGRPAPGTAGRKWMTTDGGVKLWYDTGSVWEEIAYVQSSGTANLPGDLTVAGNTTMNGNVALGEVTTSVVPSVTGTSDLGTTALRWRDLFVDAVTTTGTVTANAFSGSGASLTGITAASVAPGTFAGGSYTFSNALVLSGSLLMGSGTRVREAFASIGGVSGTQTINFLSGITRITLTGNATITLGQLDNGIVILQIVQDATGGRTLTISNAVYPSATPPAFTTTAGRMDMLQVVMANNTPYISVLGQDYVP